MSSIIAPLITTSIAVLILGSIYRLYRVIRTPVDRHVAITPTPTSRSGVIVALLFESISFRTLFKASLWTWVFGWLFHVCLLLTLIIHARFIAIPPPALTAWLMPHTSFISAGLVIGLLGLFARRLVIARVRYVSAISDYLHLILLLSIAAVGIFLSSTDSVNVYELTLFIQGLFRGDWLMLAPNFLLALHIIGACALLCLYPFSKLFHGPLLWFNPTRSSTGRPRS